jgi:hypothetical protein
MKKIPTLYVRDPLDPRHVTSTIHPDCGWVLKGEGVPIRKYDGTAMLRHLGSWWARRTVRPEYFPPAGFWLVMSDGSTAIGWEPAEQSPFAKHLREALDEEGRPPWADGTYELCGPKVNGNPEDFPFHVLVEHARAERVFDILGAREMDPASMVRRVGTLGWEGVVWHHRDGRMAKLKVRDLERK